MSDHHLGLADTVKIGIVAQFYRQHMMPAALSTTVPTLAASTA
jgi:hypothetical protein